MLSLEEQDYYEELGYQRGIDQGVTQSRREIIRKFLRNGGTKEMAITMLGVTEEEIAQAEVDITQEA